MWEAPHRVVLAWHLGPDWRFDPDPARATEIVVRFVVEGPSTTRVELVHSGFERHGEQAEAMRQPIASARGWSGLLELYAQAARD